MEFDAVGRSTIAGTKDDVAKLGLVTATQHHVAQHQPRPRGRGRVTRDLEPSGAGAHGGLFGAKRAVREADTDAAAAPTGNRDISSTRCDRSPVEVHRVVVTALAANLDTARTKDLRPAFGRLLRTGRDIHAVGEQALAEDADASRLGFDHAALELHAIIVVRVLAAKIDTCKTRDRRVEHIHAMGDDIVPFTQADDVHGAERRVDPALQQVYPVVRSARSVDEHSLAAEDAGRRRLHPGTTDSADSEDPYSAAPRFDRVRIRAGLQDHALQAHALAANFPAPTNRNVSRPRVDRRIFDPNTRQIDFILTARSVTIVCVALTINAKCSAVRDDSRARNIDSPQIRIRRVGAQIHVQ